MSSPTLPGSAISAATPIAAAAPLQPAECQICGLGEVVGGACTFCGLGPEAGADTAGPGTEAEAGDSAGAGSPDAEPGATDPETADLARAPGAGPEAADPVEASDAEPEPAGPAGRPGTGAEPRGSPWPARGDRVGPLEAPESKRAGGLVCLAGPADSDPFWLGRALSARPGLPEPPPAPACEVLGPRYLNPELRKLLETASRGPRISREGVQGLLDSEKGVLDAETILQIDAALAGPIFIEDKTARTRDDLHRLHIFAELRAPPEAVFTRQEVGVFDAGSGRFEYVVRDEGDPEGFAPALDLLRGRRVEPVKVVATKVFWGRAPWEAFKAAQTVARGAVVIAAAQGPALPGAASSPLALLFSSLAGGGGRLALKAPEASGAGI